MKDTNANSGLTPEHFTGLKLKKRALRAVGFPAIVSSFGHIVKYMNFTEGVKTMFKINQKGGFDCPGCAWPDPDDDRSALGEYCENGIKAIAEEAQSKTIGRDFFEKHRVEELLTWSDFELGKSGRLAEPLVLNNGKYTPLSWEAAFDLIATELNALDSPEEAIFYTSGRTSNEAAFLYQLFVRQFGTNNMPDCSNMCHESSGKALSKTIGIGKGTVTLDDFTKADLVIVMGQNPGTNHPRMLSALEKCKLNGGKIIAINPLPEAGLLHFINPQSPVKMLSGGTPLADLFLQVKINGDMALLKAIMKILWKQEQQQNGRVFDLNFIKNKTIGYEDFINDIEKYSLDDLIKQSGVRQDLVHDAAQMIAEKQRIIVCWAMGLTQHKNSVATIQEIVNLLLLRGSIGIEGGGVCPVRGHSNVQGDRTMGIWEAPSEAFLNKIKDVFGFEPPRKHGYNTVEAIKAMHAGKCKVFFAMGGNFLSATPDTIYTAEALKKCRLTVHVSTKLNRSHLVHGEKALILPCLGRTDIDRQASGEQFVTCENSMGIVHLSRGILEPPSKDLKSEVAIVCELAHKVQSSTPNPQSSIDWLKLKDNYDKIRDLIEKTIPGFDNFNEKVRRPEGFYLPNKPRDEQGFNTAMNKAHFTINTPLSWELKKGEYLMMTIRSHDQFNTTIYGLNDRYRGVFNERRVVLMNEKDMKTEGVKVNDVVDLFGEYNGIKREARHFIAVPYDIPQGNVATYFPEANSLVPIESFADESFTPTSKSVVIRLVKTEI